MNLEMYFPTNNQIRERIFELGQQGIDLSGLLREIEFIEEKEDVLILKKTTIVTITNFEEFILIFGENGITQGTIQLNNGDKTITIDDNYILDKINLLLEDCPQSSKLFCDKNPQELKDLILNKIGTHTIEETLVLEKISTIPHSQVINISDPFVSVIPTKYESPNKNENYSLTVISELENIVSQYEWILSARAQEEQFQSLGNDNYNLSFLNGFTIGFGFERDWSYEYNLLDIIPIYVEMHSEVGLGIGLRIPIDVKIEIEMPQIPQSRNLLVTYTGTTLDIGPDRYEDLGIDDFQVFAGKEFNSYLGPRLDLMIQVFDETIYELNESLVPIDKLEGNDFVPPLDSKSEEITRYQVDCSLVRTCFETPIASGGLYPGVRAEMIGEKITIDIQLKEPSNKDNEITFLKNGERKIYQYQIENRLRSASSENLFIPYDLSIQNVRYHSILDFIPMVKLSVELDSWIFPLEVGTDWIELPTIKIEDMVFEPHDGTLDAFNAKDLIQLSQSEPLEIPAPFVDQSKDPQSYVDRYNNEPSYKKWFDDNYPEYDSIYQAVGLEPREPKPKPEATCGSGTELVNGICQMVRDEEPSGGGCLIATAAYGSELAPQVQFLREIRDNTVMSTSSGTAFMTGFNQLYYSFSPTIADMERENPAFRDAVRMFITPMISTLSIMTLAENEDDAQVLGLGISVISLNLGMYIVAPVAIGFTIHRRLKSRNIQYVINKV